MLSRDVLLSAVDELVEGEVYSGMVMELGKGGVVISVGGILGMVPYSLLSWKYFSNPSEVCSLGQFILVVLKSKTGLIFSAKDMEKNPWTDNLYEYLDKEVEGKVVILRRYGAFVDFCNVRGLLHKSEMPWPGVEVKDCLYLGQAVRVKVISIDVVSKSIGLSMAGLYKDSWRTVLELGEIMDVNVVRRSEGGLRVTTADGLIGNVPEEECGWAGVPTLVKSVNAGDKLSAKIISADHESRKITFSVRAMSEAPWLDLTRACAYKTTLNAKIISIGLKYLLLEILPGVFSSLEIADLPHSVRQYHIGQSLCVTIRRISWEKPMTVKVVLAEFE